MLGPERSPGIPHASCDVPRDDSGRFCLLPSVLPATRRIILTRALEAAPERYGTQTLYPHGMDDHSAHDRRPPALEQQHAGTASTTDAPADAVTKESEREYLVHRHALRQVAREVRVDASQQGQFVGEEL